jgi:hypothetical protein
VPQSAKDWQGPRWRVFLNLPTLGRYILAIVDQVREAPRLRALIVDPVMWLLNGALTFAPTAGAMALEVPLEG